METASPPLPPSSSSSSSLPSSSSSSSQLPSTQTKRGRRARDLLRDYYGLDEKKEEQDIPSSIPKRKDDIDGTSFEADKYFTNLLHNKNLSDLLKTETQLQTGFFKKINFKKSILKCSL